MPVDYPDRRGGDEPKGENNHHACENAGRQLRAEQFGGETSAHGPKWGGAEKAGIVKCQNPGAGLRRRFGLHNRPAHRHIDARTQAPAGYEAAHHIEICR